MKAYMDSTQPQWQKTVASYLTKKSLLGSQEKKPWQSRVQKGLTVPFRPLHFDIEGKARLLFDDSVTISQKSFENNGDAQTFELDLDFCRDALLSRSEQKSYGADNLEGAIDSTISHYAGVQKRMKEKFSGEELEAQLNKLDELMDQAKKNVAKHFSEHMGNFFDEYGVSGNKDKIYQSVLTEMEQRLAQRMGSVPSNSEAKNTDVYTLDEMKKLYDFSKEMEKYTGRYYNNSDMWREVSYRRTNTVMTGCETEEYLGLRLAELSLKGKVFNDKADVSNDIKDIVNQTIENFITKSIEAEQADLDKYANLQIQATYASAAKGAYSVSERNQVIQEIRKAHTAIDKDAVYSVINKVMSSYEQTNNAGKALIDGVIWARDSYASKTYQEAYHGINRYDSTTEYDYWNNFFGQANIAGYIRKNSGLNCMVQSWNDFMGKITSDKTAFFDLSFYAVI